jgi:hypothetical protein
MSLKDEMSRVKRKKKSDHKIKRTDQLGLAEIRPENRFSLGEGRDEMKNSSREHENKVLASKYAYTK